MVKSVFDLLSFLGVVFTITITLYIATGQLLVTRQFLTLFYQESYIK